MRDVLAGVVLGLAAQTGCLTRETPGDPFATEDSYGLAEDASSVSSAASTNAANSSGTAALSDAGSAPGPALSADAASAPADSDCDLSGRWMATERRVATGLGVKQAGIVWAYYDFTQVGAQLVARKGLVCGTAVKPIDALSASVDMTSSWPLFMANNPMDGRTGTVSSSATGCDFKMARFYTVMGATASYYRDASRELPTLDQQGTASTPGWEDYDHDGKPASTLTVGGILTGTMQAVVRAWGEYSGTVPKHTKAFQVSLNWNQDFDLLAVSADALKAQGARDGNNALHFVQFAKLSDTQATGDDAAICKSILSLAPQLTPDANK